MVCHCVALPESKADNYHDKVVFQEVNVGWMLYMRS